MPKEKAIIGETFAIELKNDKDEILDKRTKFTKTKPKKEAKPKAKSV